MKKLLSVILALAIVFSMAITAFAEVENFAEGIKWTKGHAGSISEKNGVYKASGIDQPYKSPFINILPAVKAALGTDTDAELAIKFKIRANFTKGNEGETAGARVLLRGGSVPEDMEVSDWNDAYEEAVDGETFFYSDAGKNIMKYFESGIEFTDEEWTTVTFDFDVSDAIVNCDMVTAWNFCIDTISPIDMIDSIEFKDFILAHYDDELFEEEEPEKVEVEKPADKPDSSTPAGDVENFAENLKWEGFSGAQVTTTEDGTIIAKNITRAYTSPKTNVLPAIKKALGDDDSLDEVYIVFDVRGTYKADYDGDDATASTLFRGTNGLKVAASEVDDWTDAYYDSFDDAEPLFTNSQGNIMKYLGKGATFGREWSTVVIPLEFEGEQITNDAITKWDFCFDNMKNFEGLESIEIKNFAITLEEPEIEDEDEKTDTNPKPDADKPAVNATPTPYVVWATPIGYVDSSVAPTPDAQNPQTPDGETDLLPILIAAGAVAVIAIVAVVIVIIKKKKNKAE